MQCASNNKFSEQSVSKRYWAENPRVYVWNFPTFHVLIILGEATPTENHEM